MKGAQRGSGNVTGLSLFIHSSEESWPFQGSFSQNKCINRHFFFCFTNPVMGGAAVSLTLVPKVFFHIAGQRFGSKSGWDRKIKTSKKQTRFRTKFTKLVFSHNRLHLCAGCNCIKTLSDVTKSTAMTQILTLVIFPVNPLTMLGNFFSFQGFVVLCALLPCLQYMKAACE